MPRRQRIGQILVAVSFLAQLAACGRSSNMSAPFPASGSGNVELPPVGAEAYAGSSLTPAFPVDLRRPWEAVDAAGKVVPLRGGLSLDSSSVFVPGVQTDSVAGSVSPSGEASALSSGSLGGKQASFAVYRLTLSGGQPGVVAADINFKAVSGGGGPSNYWLGLSRYSDGAWEWHGPFSDGQLRLSTGAAVAAGASYVSPLGNLFIAIAGYDGAAMDIVGVGANPRDTADSTAPGAPGGLTATPVAGGLELQWNELLAPDLAGYRVYYSNSAFSSPAAAGVKKTPFLEGTTRCLLSGISGLKHVRITAVDISGNESALSTEATGTPLAGSPPSLLVSTDLNSGRVGAAATLTVSGAATYDVDLDGDGSFDTIGSSATAYPIDTSATGILRPRVRASSGATAVALGGVSLIIAANFPPVASLVLSPTQCTVWGGETVSVAFDASASTDDGGAAALQFAYDPQGDGSFSAFSGAETTNKNYSAPGTYLAAVIVRDADGLEGYAYAVETVRQAAGFATCIVDDRPTCGNYCSAAMINGNPALAYRKTDAAGLSYVRALTPRGEQWSDPVDIDLTATDVDCSLAEVAGRPAIAYVDTTSGNIRYVRALDETGQSIASWPGTPADAVVAANSTMLSLTDVNGRPGLAWASSGTGYYRRASGTGEQTAQWSASPLSISSDTCTFLSMKMVSGNPAIAFIGNNQQRYVRSTTANGTTLASWPSGSVLISGADSVAEGVIAFDVVAGRPAVGYRKYVDVDKHALRYVRANTATGSNVSDWPAPVAVTNIPRYYAWMSLADVDGKPALTIDYDVLGISTNHFAIGLNAGGTAWTALQSTSPPGLGISEWTDTSIVSGPGWCGIGSSPQSGGAAIFHTLTYN